MGRRWRKNARGFGLWVLRFQGLRVPSFELRVPSNVKLSVYDIAGREVARLVDGWRGVGVHEVVFDGSDLGSGMYVYRLEAADIIASGKMVLMK